MSERKRTTKKEVEMLRMQLIHSRHEVAELKRQLAEAQANNLLIIKMLQKGAAGRNTGVKP